MDSDSQSSSKRLYVRKKKTVILSMVLPESSTLFKGRYAVQQDHAMDLKNPVSRLPHKMYFPLCSVKGRETDAGDSSGRRNARFPGAV
jgi:hypothetical protein